MPRVYYSSALDMATPNIAIDNDLQQRADGLKLMENIPMELVQAVATLIGGGQALFKSGIFYSKIDNHGFEAYGSAARVVGLLPGQNFAWFMHRVLLDDQCIVKISMLEAQLSRAASRYGAKSLETLALKTSLAAVKTAEGLAEFLVFGPTFSVNGVTGGLSDGIKKMLACVDCQLVTLPITPAIRAATCITVSVSAASFAKNEFSLMAGLRKLLALLEAAGSPIVDALWAFIAHQEALLASRSMANAPAMQPGTEVPVTEVTGAKRARIPRLSESEGEEGASEQDIQPVYPPGHDQLKEAGHYAPYSVKAGGSVRPNGMRKNHVSGAKASKLRVKELYTRIVKSAATQANLPGLAVQILREHGPLERAIKGMYCTNVMYSFSTAFVNILRDLLLKMHFEFLSMYPEFANVPFADVAALSNFWGLLGRFDDICERFLYDEQKDINRAVVAAELSTNHVNDAINMPIEERLISTLVVRRAFDDANTDLKEAKRLAVKAFHLEQQNRDRQHTPAKPAPKIDLTGGGGNGNKKQAAKAKAAAAKAKTLPADEAAAHAAHNHEQASLRKAAESAKKELAANK